MCTPGNVDRKNAAMTLPGGRYGQSLPICRKGSYGPLSLLLQYQIPYGNNRART